MDHGADVNVRSKSGTTPLHDAMNFLSQEIVDFLLKNGADPNVKDEKGESAVDIDPSRFNKVVTLPESEDVTSQTPMTSQNAGGDADIGIEEAKTAAEETDKDADEVVIVEPVVETSDEKEVN